MKRRFKLLAVILGVVALGTLIIGTTVFAHGPGDADDFGSGYCDGAGFHGHGAGYLGSEAAADLLGLTPEALHEQRLAGKSLAEIAAEQGISEDELVNAIMATRTAAVQERVADGYLTPEQAELMLQQMEENTRLAVNRTTTGAPEWAGTCGYGNGYGQPGEGYGPGMMQRWGTNSDAGARNNAGAGFGGHGMMGRWAR
ncbi:MAG: hypothetical protein ABID87_06640 [Chloroflexota bacterium]